MTPPGPFALYDRHQTYDWNYDHAPDPVEVDVPAIPGDWTYCGLPVDSPLGVPAGPLLNGKWCLYYASLGFDVVTYKTVRGRARECYPLPNLQPVECEQIAGGTTELPAASRMTGSWAVSYGMPSKHPDTWRADIESTRRALPAGKLLSVSVVGTIQDNWTIDDLAADYAQCARWAVDSGADVVETNFSCPNVTTCDGQLYQNPLDAEVVVKQVRDTIGSIPYVVKIGHVPTREEAQRLLHSLGGSVDGIAMTNSVAAHVWDGAERLFEGQKRGICGSAILDASVEQVELFSELTRETWPGLALIGVGGVSTSEHVQRYLAAGAEACHIATAAMINPGVALEIRRSLTEPSG